MRYSCLGTSEISRQQEQDSPDTTDGHQRFVQPRLFSVHGYPFKAGGSGYIYGQRSSGSFTIPNAAKAQSAMPTIIVVIGWFQRLATEPALAETARRESQVCNHIRTVGIAAIRTNQSQTASLSRSRSSTRTRNEPPTDQIRKRVTDPMSKRRRRTVARGLNRLMPEIRGSNQSGPRMNGPTIASKRTGA